MTLTRDSLVWWFALLGAIVAYLISVGSPPNEWEYRQWLQAAAALFGMLAGKLSTSPLPLSYQGKAAMSRGESHRDIPAPS